MKAMFPHIGESILRAIIESNPSPLLTSFGRPDGASVAVLAQVRLVFPEANICCDGSQKLDLALLINNVELIPIEVKLGREGLYRANVEALLKPCTFSGHTSDRRIKGKMLAVLNRRFGPELTSAIGDDVLHADTPAGLVRVVDDWGIIARRSILTSWQKQMPSFNGKQRFFVLEDMCGQFGRASFNELVTRMLKNEDFYEDWIETSV